MNKLNRILWSGLALGLVACGDDVTVQEPTPLPTPGIASVTVSPSPVTLETGKSVQMVANVTLQSGATGTPTVVWTTPTVSPAVVTVSNTGVVTAASPGSAAVTATVSLAGSTATAQGSASVTVVAPAACTITGVSVSPSPSADLVHPSTLALQAASTGSSACTSAQLNGFTWSGGNAAIATINANGVITTAGPGTTAFTVKNTFDQSKAAVMSVNVTIPAPATVSIQSITQYATNVPVDLSNVGGQIEITLNVDPGAAPSITRAQALINGIVVAEQCFSGNCNAPASAAEAPATAVTTLVLNTNTRQVKKAGNNIIPVVYNGPGQVTGRIYVAGSSTPVTSVATPLVMQNKDAFLQGNLAQTPASPSPSFSNSNPAAGTVWYKGNISYGGGQYVAFYPYTPTSVAFNSNNCTDAGSAPTGTPTTGLVFSGTLACTGVEGGVQLTGIGAVVKGPASGTVPADVMYLGNNGPEVVGSVFKVNGDDRYNLLSGTFTKPSNIYIDNVVPTLAVGNVAFNDAFDQPWVNASYAFSQDITVSDGGSGVNAGSVVARDYAPGAFIPATAGCTATVVTTGNDYPETVTSNATDGKRICAYAADNLGNAVNTGPSNYFGVDKVVPTSRIAGSTGALPGIAAATVPGVASTANTTIYNIANVPAFLNTAAYGVEGQDTRSGFNQNAVAGFPAKQAITRFSVQTSPAATISCGFSAAMGQVLSDNWVRANHLPPAVWTTAGTLDCYTLPLTLWPLGNASQPGYYSLSMTVTDRAGNTTAPITRNWLIDRIAAPALTQVSFATTFYNPGQPASFTLFGSDDLEVIEATFQIAYPGTIPVSIVYQPAAVGTRWDGTLTNNLIGATSTLPFIIGRVDFTCDGAGAPYAGASGCAGPVVAGGLPATAGAFNDVDTDANTVFANSDKLPTSIIGTLADAGGNLSAPSAPANWLPAQWQSSVAQAWVGADIVTWTISQDANNWYAQHKASTSIVVPYFDGALLVRNNVGVVTVCGNFGAPALTDNGLNRFWTYTLSKTGLSTCGGAGTYHVVGLKGSAALVNLPGV